MRNIILCARLCVVQVRPTPREFVSVFDLLFRKLKFRMFYVRNNPGRQRDRNVVPFLKNKARPNQCCYEIALVRNVSA